MRDAILDRILLSHPPGYFMVSIPPSAKPSFILLFYKFKYEEIIITDSIPKEEVEKKLH